MGVYVDNAKHKFRNMIMCHMMADTQKELIDFAVSIGLRESYIQSKGTYKEHFDISQSMRKKAIENGAKEVSREFIVALMKRKGLE